MAYAVKWNDAPSKGPSADEWFIALKKSGWKGRLPVDKKDELEDENQDFWRAFWELNSSRQIGFGTGAISYTTVTEWLNEEEIFRIEDRIYYRRILAHMDRAYLEGIKANGTRSRSGAIRGRPQSGKRRAQV